MNKTFLLIGGNLGDRLALINEAKYEIENRIGAIENVSSIYESASWGFKTEQNFLNQVIIVKTKLNPQEVLKHCLEIEDQLGRVRSSSGYQSRTMDIDILFYNDEMIDVDNLIVPHPKLHERRFTMEPLVEIAPEYVHPVFKKALKELLSECKDNGEVKVY